MKLEKFLAECGVTSRKHASEVIEKGLVEINNRIITSVKTDVDPAKDDVRYKGVRCKVAAKHYVAVHKPRNFLSTFEDGLGRRSVHKLLPKIRGAKLFPVGRLDKDTEGLMLFTNDGELANKIMHPRYGVNKVYYVVCSGFVDDSQLQKLKKGIWLSEGKVVPKEIAVLKRLRQKSVLRITICDGKKNEIKRVMKKIGSRVTYLKRLAIGPLKLGKLKRGSYKILDNNEVNELIRLFKGSNSPNEN